MKGLVFLGTSQDDLRAMPIGVRHAFGVELMRVQFGGEPLDFKPMPDVGAGAYDIRVRDASGAFRVVYVANSRMLSMCCTRSRRRRRGRQEATSNLRAGVTS